MAWSMSCLARGRFHRQKISTPASARWLEANAESSARLSSGRGLGLGHHVCRPDQPVHHHQGIGVGETGERGGIQRLPLGQRREAIPRLDMITPEQQGEPAEIRAVGHGVATESERQAQRARLLRVRGRHRAVPHGSGCLGRSARTSIAAAPTTPATTIATSARSGRRPLGEGTSADSRISDLEAGGSGGGRSGEGTCEARSIDVRPQLLGECAGLGRGLRLELTEQGLGQILVDPQGGGPAFRRVDEVHQPPGAVLVGRLQHPRLPRRRHQSRHRHFAPIHQRCATPPRPPPDGGRSADPRASARIRPRPTRGARAPALRPRPPRLRSTGAPPAVASPPAHRSGPPPARARRIRRRAPRTPGRPAPGGDCTAYCGANAQPTPRPPPATGKPSNWPWTGARAAEPGQGRAATRLAWAGSVQAPVRRHAARGSRWCRVLGCRSWRGRWQAHSDEKTGARRHEDTLNIPSRDSLNRPASLA